MTDEPEVAVTQAELDHAQQTAGPVDGVSAEVAAYIEGQIAQVNAEITRVERAIQRLAEFAGLDAGRRAELDEIVAGTR